MNGIDYYKSLISDEEVIKALVKESKAREAETVKERTRVRPNLNFFQRTVTNLVSSNRRLTIRHEENASKERRKHVRKIKTPHTLMKEILLSNKINFVKSEEQNDLNFKERVNDKEEITNDLKRNFDKTNGLHKLPEKHKTINFNLNFDKSRFTGNTSTSSNENVSQCERHRRSSSSDSSDVSIISISSISPSKKQRRLSASDSSDVSVITIASSDSTSSDSDVIKISDSDSDASKSGMVGEAKNRLCKSKKKKCKKRK